MQAVAHTRNQVEITLLFGIAACMPSPGTLSTYKPVPSRGTHMPCGVARRSFCGCHACLLAYRKPRVVLLLLLPDVRDCEISRHSRHLSVASSASRPLAAFDVGFSITRSICCTPKSPINPIRGRRETSLSHPTGI